MVTCCGKYKARDLREVVEFQRKTRTADALGGFSASFSSISGTGLTRAMVRPLSGSERWLSNRTEAHANYRVVTRYFDGLRPGDTCVIRGRPGDITHVANVDMRNEWLEIDVLLGEAI